MLSKDKYMRLQDEWKLKATRPAGQVQYWNLVKIISTIFFSRTACTKYFYMHKYFIWVFTVC